MINNDQSTLSLYCCEDVKSHRSGGDTVSLRFRLGFGHKTVIAVNKLFQILRNIMLLPTV